MKRCSRCKKRKPPKSFTLITRKSGPNKGYSCRTGQCTKCLREMQREKRAVKKAALLCIECDKPAVPNGVRCDDHARQNAKRTSNRAHELTSNELCAECGKRPRENGVTRCCKCRLRNNKAHRDRRKKRAEKAGRTMRPYPRTPEQPRAMNAS